MRELILLPNSVECCAYVRKHLLKNEMLRDSFDEGGWVYQLIKRFARRPRFFYKPSSEYVVIQDEQGQEYREFIEAPHFSPWWGGIQLREYDNKVVQDLYYLHEICHAATMPYGPDCHHSCTDPITFKNKIRDNEHQASTLSEMTIYCVFPRLRALSFQHEIFVDRFLFPDGNLKRVDASLIQRWHLEPDIVEREMMYARAAILTAPFVDESDLAAFWLKRFYSQGKAWTNIWTNPKGDYPDIPVGGRFREVESAMIRLRDECDSFGREEALRRHIEWLQSDSVTCGTEIPFYPEARAFCMSYLQHKKLYFENLHSRGKHTETHSKEA